jgi:hypothetical protein
MYSFLGIARPNFHIQVSVSDFYSILPGSVHILYTVSCSRTDRSIVGTYCIIRSQTHECGNWDCVRTIPFLGISVSNFRYWFFAVRRRIGHSMQHSKSIVRSFMQFIVIRLCQPSKSEPELSQRYVTVILKCMYTKE